MEGIFKWVVLKGPFVLRLFAALFLIAFIISGAWFAYDFSRMQETFLSGISTQVDDPNQKYPGLESILLSGIDASGLRAMEASTQVTDEFAQRLANLKADLKATPTEATTKASSSSKVALQSRCGGLNAELCSHLTVYTVPNRSGAMTLTDKYFGLRSTDDEAFLFLPAMLVPTAELPEHPSDLQLLAALLNNTALTGRDLAASQRVAADVCNFTNVDVFSDSSSLVRSQPIQSYFITDNGLLRICEGNIKDQYTFYLNQFTPTIFFPSTN